MASFKLPKLTETMSWCHSDSKLHNASQVWTIDNFSFITTTPGVQIESSEFSGPDGAIQWQMVLHPGGCDNENQDYVSLFLKMNTPDAIARAYFKFAILDAEFRSVHVKPGGGRYKFEYNHPVEGHRQFIERQELYSKDGKYLSDDTLVIRCSIEFVTKVEQYSNQVGFHPLQVSSRELFDGLWGMFQRQELTDVTICALGTEFKAHKVILAAGSPVFKGMFSHDLKENQESRVEISHLDPAVVRAMLEFIYTGQSPRVTEQCGASDDKELEQHFIIELLKAADGYQLDTLKLVCAKALEKTITTRSVGQIWHLGNLYNLPQLKEEAGMFVRANPSETFLELLNSTHDGNSSTGSLPIANCAESAKDTMTGPPNESKMQEEAEMGQEQEDEEEHDDANRGFEDF